MSPTQAESEPDFPSAHSVTALVSLAVGSRLQGQLHSALKVAAALEDRPRGLTLAQLIRETGIPRSTLYRRLITLREGGWPVRKDVVNGEVRYHLDASTPTLGANEDQRQALRLALEALRPLAGTRLREALEAYEDEPGETIVWRAEPCTGDPGIVRRIEDALRRNRCLRLGYVDRDGGATMRRVEPWRLEVRTSGLYLRAYDLDRDDWRIFKVRRIRQALASPTSRTMGRMVPGDEESVRVWMGGERVDVAIRFRGPSRELLEEYPLVPGQTLLREGESTLLRATVLGLVEVTRWVLGWGAAAEVLSPQVLRSRVRRELRDALASYDRPKTLRSRRAPDEVSHGS